MTTQELTTKTEAMTFEEIVARLTESRYTRTIANAQRNIDRFTEEVQKGHIGYAIRHHGADANVAEHFVRNTEYFFDMIREARSADEVIDNTSSMIRALTDHILTQATYAGKLDTDDAAQMSARAKHLENIQSFLDDFRSLVDASS